LFRERKLVSSFKFYVDHCADLFTCSVVSHSAHALASALPVNLGSAASYALLAGATITSTGASQIKGDLGLYPGTSVTGFPPATLVGQRNVANVNALNAKRDLAAAAAEIKARQGGAALNGDAGGKTLAPGLYTSSSSLAVTGVLKLDCTSQALNPVWVFQIGSTLVLATGAKVQFVNCGLTANPKVYWNVGSSATLKTTSEIVGTVIAYASITANTGAKVTGALLARTAAVTLDTNAITRTGAQA
jgi:hypothetical protein